MKSSRLSSLTKPRRPRAASRLALCALLGGSLLCVPHASALALSQDGENALSEGEIEKLREAAPLYSDRVLIFAGFLDRRALSILTLSTGRRRPGREEDIHDQMEQFTAIAESLQDNLDDYDQRHRDVRKALPKLLSAIDRWDTSIRTPPDHSAYNVSRRLALEATGELRKDVTKMIEDQKAYFLAHPPTKEDEKKPERRG